MDADAQIKRVLVGMGDNNRVVSFQTTDSDDITALSASIEDVFSDVLLPGQTFFLQVKSEEWSGVFLDLLEKAEIRDKSVIKAVVRKPAAEVYL